MCIHNIIILEHKFDLRDHLQIRIAIAYKYGFGTIIDINLDFEC